MCEDSWHHGTAERRFRCAESSRGGTPHKRVSNSSAAVSGKKKKQKKPKTNKTQSLNDFLADASIGGGKITSKEPPKRTGSWADAMEERLETEGGLVVGC